jgi:hypothetical protein
MCLATFSLRYIPDPLLKYSLMAIMVVLSVLLFYGGDGLLFNTIIKKKMI